MTTTQVDGRTCARCNEWKPRARFNANSKAKHGMQSYCKLCVAAHRKIKRTQARAAVPIKKAPEPIPPTPHPQPRQLAPLPHVAANPVMALFLPVGGQLFNLLHIASIDRSVPGLVEIQLAQHDIDPKTGQQTPVRFTYEGDEAERFLASLEGMTAEGAAGQAERLTYLEQAYQASEARAAAAEARADKAEKRAKKIAMALKSLDEETG